MANNRGEREADKVISNLNLPTQISGKPLNTPLTEQSFVDIWELEFDVNSKEPKILISGNDSQIILQTSLLNAMNQLLANRGITYFNFEEWKESFENGYQSFNTGASEELKSLWKEFVYDGIKKDNRPKIVELKLHGNNKKKPTYKVVQFFPNRKSPTEWLLFSGSYREIAWQITNWWNQKVGSNHDRKGGELPYLKGQPMIKLYFFQDFDKVGKKANGTKKQPVKGEITFRIMGKSDNPASPNVDKLSKSDLRTYAERIQKQFGDNGRYVWQKGKAVISYRNRPQGIECWYLVKSKAAGIELLKKILAVIDKPLDLKRVKYSITEAEDKAYPSTPETITVLGEQVVTAQQRPIADVRFVRAEIVLPSLTKPIQLVNRDKVVYKI
jgi:hypothetical protein